jgi:hypothetical protein
VSLRNVMSLRSQSPVLQWSDWGERHVRLSRQGERSHIARAIAIQCAMNRSLSGERSGLNGVTTGARTPRMVWIMVFRSDVYVGTAAIITSQLLNISTVNFPHYAVSVSAFRFLPRKCLSPSSDFCPLYI